MSVENKTVITDPGIDDAASINHLKKTDEKHTLISSFGNVSGEQAYQNLQRLVQHLRLKGWSITKGPDGPLDPKYEKYADKAEYGGNGPDGLWEIREPNYTIEHNQVSEVDPSQIKEIISLAPLTEPLRLMREGANPEQILIMGGTFGQGNAPPLSPDGEYSQGYQDFSNWVSEWNIFKDVPAADEYFNIHANNNTYLVPLDVCLQVPLTIDAINTSLVKQSVEHRFMKELLSRWAENFGKVNPIVNREILLADLVAVILYKNKDFADWQNQGIEIVTEIGEELGKTLLSKNRPTLNIAVSITDKEAVYEAVCQTVFGE